jgi:CBS domain-containing protein
MHVFEIMTRRVFWCRPADTLAAAAAVMWEHDIGSLPVLGDADEVVGMITDRDICMAAYTRGSRLADVDVGSAMSRGLHACAPEATVGAAEELMRLDRIRRTPVVDARGRLVGILSLADLAREALHQKRCKHGEDLCAEITSTLAAVSEPRAHRPGTAKEPS